MVNSTLGTGQVEYLNLDARVRDLRQQTRDRRVSFPALNAPLGADDANSPWDIVNEEQLQSWAETEPRSFLVVLNTLRQQRDLGIEATDLYSDAVKDREEYNLKYRDERTTNTGLKEQLRIMEDQLNASQGEVRELEEQIRIRRDVTLVGSAASFTKRIQKLPDPKKFTDGVNPTWEDWSNKMRTKLRVNADHWETEDAKIGYTLSRIGDPAIKHTYSRSGPRAKKPFQTCDEIFETLAESYENPDQKRHNSKEYHAMVQGTRKFIDFYAEFRRLSSEMDITEETLMEDLEKKVAPRLRALWHTRDLTTLKQAKEFMIKLDNQQRNERAMKEKAAQSQTTTQPRTPKQVTFTNPVTSRPSYPPRRPTPPATEQNKVDQERGSCFICHKDDHLARNCPQRSPRPSGPYNSNSFQRNTTPRVNEIDTTEIEEGQPDSDYQSDSESEN